MKSVRILIVDDNSLNVELATFVLQSKGLTVDAVTEACRAHDRVSAHRPDLILMDVQMPELDGLSLARMLKADPLTRDIVIVAFTAFAMKGDEARMREAGCDGYLSKPIDVANFAERVLAFLPARAP